MFQGILGQVDNILVLIVFIFLILLLNGKVRMRPDRQKKFDEIVRRRGILLKVLVYGGTLIFAARCYPAVRSSITELLDSLQFTIYSGSNIKKLLSFLSKISTIHLCELFHNFFFDMMTEYPGPALGNFQNFVGDKR